MAASVLECEQGTSIYQGSTCVAQQCPGPNNKDSLIVYHLDDQQLFAETKKKSDKKLI